MPYIHVKVTADKLEPEQVRQLQGGITGLMARELNKVGELTAVSVERVEPAMWSIGAQPQALAAHVDAIVSAGTNTEEQKARFIAEADALLRRVLGEALPLVCYVVIHTVAKDAWGYGGKTQAARAAER